MPLALAASKTRALADALRAGSPARAIAKAHGVSDAAVYRIARRLKIGAVRYHKPKPPRGLWIFAEALRECLGLDGLPD